MTFQYVIDNSESITINTSKVVASTQARDGTVRSVSRGAQIWTFSVQLPDGPRWSDNRQSIAKISALDRVTPGNIQINNAGQNYIYGYQGTIANVSAVTATWTTGNTITLTGGQAGSGFNFRAGDILQLGSTGKVYMVVADVASGTNTVTLNRPIIDAAGSATLRIGTNCVWNVICTSLPDWTIFGYNQVQWSGPFVFVENLA
jgi:hypothetical protein